MTGKHENAVASRRPLPKPLPVKEGARGSVLWVAGKASRQIDVLYWSSRLGLALLSDYRFRCREESDKNRVRLVVRPLETAKQLKEVSSLIIELAGLIEAETQKQAARDRKARATRK